MGLCVGAVLQTKGKGTCKQAVAYVQGLHLPDPDAERVFLLLVERTRTSSWDGEQPPVMGLELREADIPYFAASAGIDAPQFRRLLRAMKITIPMDVLEHRDGVWEIVYGPSYTNRKNKAAAPTSGDAPIGGIQPFTMPGWDRFSTWGYEEGLGHFYAQLYRNSDDRDAAPRIWITPPAYVVATVDELAETIATAIAPYEPMYLTASVISKWLKQ